MDNSHKLAKSINDNSTLLTPEIIINNYNKLNGIANETFYPWDLHEKKVQDYFVPTYKNITLYYKDYDALLKPPIKSNTQKKKGGGANKVKVFFM